MGTFFHPITLIGTSGQQMTVDALVDTGSTFSTLPRPVLEQLGIQPFARIRLRLANRQPAEADVGEIGSRLLDLAARTIICSFGGEETPAIIGAHTLEAFLLGVDPDQKRLVSLEAWWT